MTELITLNLQNYYCSAGTIQCIFKLLQERMEAETNLLRGFFCVPIWTKLSLHKQNSPQPEELSFSLWNRTSTLHQLDFKGSSKMAILLSWLLAYSSLSALDTEASSTLQKTSSMDCITYSLNDAEWNHPLLPLVWATNIWTKPCLKSDVIHGF